MCFLTSNIFFSCFISYFNKFCLIFYMKAYVMVSFFRSLVNCVIWTPWSRVSLSQSVHREEVVMLHWWGLGWDLIELLLLVLLMFLLLLVLLLQPVITSAVWLPSVVCAVLGSVSSGRLLVTRRVLTVVGVNHHWLRADPIKDVAQLYVIKFYVREEFVGDLRDNCSK